ncbi:Uncharacterized protein At1g76070 [Linum grandiflorum]
MEQPRNNHHIKSKTVFKFLKAASSINFNNPPFSPTREHSSDHHRLHNYNGFVSAPILPPRGKQRQKKKFAATGESPATSGDVHEPTSPKISCIGQIKHKKCMLPKQPAPATKAKDGNKKSKKMTAASTKENQDAKPQSPGIWKLFGAASFKKLGPSSAPARRKRSNSTSAVAGSRLFVDDGEGAAGQPLPDRAPCLSQMRRFASGHGDGLRDFDWTGQIKGVESNGAYDSDEEEETGGYSDEEMEAKEVFSVPMWVGGGGGDVVRLRPRKEVNLWKRRTIDPPRPLQLVGSY